MEQIDVKMNDVEFLCPFAHPVNHQHEVRNDVANGRIKAKRASAAGGQLSAGDGVAACKESHVVAKPDKLFRQVGSDPLSATIETRRNALNEGGDLRDFHDDLDFPRRDPNACSAAKFRGIRIGRLHLSTELTRSLKKALRLPGAGGRGKQPELSGFRRGPDRDPTILLIRAGSSLFCFDHFI